MAIVKFPNLAKAIARQAVIMEKNVKVAAAMALTNVAFKSTRDIEAEYRKTFHVRNQNFAKALLYRKATPAILVASVWYKNDFMELHTTGGIRKPTNEKVEHGGSRSAISVPFSENDRRMANGKTRKRDRAPSLLKYANDNDNKKQKAVSAVKKPFLLKTKEGKAYIVKRAKGNTTLASRKPHNGDLFLFTLAKEVKIDKKWDFNKIVEDSVEKRLDKEYVKAFEYVFNKTSVK